MFIRTSSFQADRGKLDDGIAFARENVPGDIAECDGSLGWTMLVDRQDGRAMVNSWWETEKAMNDSREKLTPLRSRAGEVFGAPAKAEQWEVVVMERRRDLKPGCGVRMTRVRLDPATVDHGIDVFRTTTVPEAQLMDGFCSITLAVNRKTGEALGTVIFDSLSSVEKTRDRARQVRATTVEKSHAEVLDVHEFELVQADVKPPKHI